MMNQEGKRDEGKARLSLVPSEIIRCIASVREFATTRKYLDPDNWQGVEIEKFRDAAYRHWLEYIDDSKSVDSESGLPHLWHLACNVAFLCEIERRSAERGKCCDVAREVNIISPADSCVMCGEYTPEGSHVCKVCRDAVG